MGWLKQADLTKEEYESLATVALAAAREAEELLGEFDQRQRVMVGRLIAEALRICLDRHGPRGQNHKLEVVSGYERTLQALYEEGEAPAPPS